MHLALFDIDGTLIRSTTIGRDVMAFALTQVFGTVGSIASYSLAGTTDRRAIYNLMRAEGIPKEAIESGLPAVYRLMAEEGQRAFAGKLQPLPGVEELLERLRSRTDVLLGLLTGNAESIAPLKLAAAGIEPEQFAVGAYGSDDEDRNRLPTLAMQRAKARIGWEINARDVTLFGDTPADIICARAAGVKVVSVASGTYAVSTLTNYHPDVLLTDLTDPAAILPLLGPC